MMTLRADEDCGVRFTLPGCDGSADAPNVGQRQVTFTFRTDMSSCQDLKPTDPVAKRASFTSSTETPLTKNLNDGPFTSSRVGIHVWSDTAVPVNACWRHP